VSRGVPIVAAQTIDPADSALVIQLESHPSGGKAASSSTPTHLVRAGDTLWSIAERAYGAGAEYPRLVEANLGRSMSDGHVFDARGVIRPGWQLVVPGARAVIDELDGQPWYEVRAGDTLSAIAESQLGDMSRWDELFDLN